MDGDLVVAGRASEEGEDDQLAEGGDEEEDEEDDTAELGTMATYVGDAKAPAGFAIVQDCPQVHRWKVRMI